MHRSILISLALSSLIPTSVIASTMTVQPGDTLSEIAERHKVSINTIMRLNRINDSNKIKVGSKLILPENASSINPTNTTNIFSHKVRKGETLSGIAMRYKTSEGALTKANNIQSSNYLYIGQTLQIPNYQGSVFSGYHKIQHF